VQLWTGLRYPRRPRSLYTARAEGTVLRRWLPVRRQAFRPQGRGAEDPGAASLDRAGDLSALSESRRSRTAHTQYPLLERSARSAAGAGRGLPLRADALRSAALDPVLLRHDG